MRPSRLRLILPAAVAAMLVLAGCTAPGSRQAAGPETVATDQTAAADDTFNDPWEDMNRSIFGFNQAVDNAVLIPVAKTYRTVLPPPVQQSIRDVLRNLNGPVIFANDVLQGEFGLAADTLGRLVINTTIGAGGLFDIATPIGIPYHANDLGITLATWGAPEGPYVMMPVFGPSNPRDIVGLIGDSFADPASYFLAQNNLYWAAFLRTGVSGIDVRSRNIESLADIEKTSLDFYATIRSLYRQRRAAQIRHERSNLPNPSPVQGSDAGPDPAISYFFAKPQNSKPQPYRELSAK